MSYSLIIADDEDAIRTGLTKFVNWHDLGFRLDGCFEDGSGVIDYLKHHKPDVVVTDIRMTRKSGLDVAQYIYDNSLQIKVVIISGYKDFEYARQAIHYNVDNYLLKPTNLDDLHSVFQGIRDKLDKESQFKREWETEKAHYGEILPLVRDQLFSDLYKGKLTDRNEIRNKLRRVLLSEVVLECPCWLVTVRMENREHKMERQSIQETDGPSSAIRNFFISNGDSIDFYQVDSPGYSMIYLAIANGRIHPVNGEEQVVKRIDSIRQSLLSFTGLNVAYSIVKGFDAVSGIMGSGRNSDEPSAGKTANAGSLATSNAIIAKLKDYVSKHYATDISLDDLAEYVFMNPTYLSRYFKQQTGENLSEYLIHTRMDRAIDLLSERKYKIYEIGEKVGYRSSKYFIKLFKQHTGYTPMEYLRHVLKAGDADESAPR